MTIAEKFYNRMDDIESMMICQDYDGLNHYGLELQYKPEDDEIHWLLSWGGPSETIIMVGRGKRAKFYYIYKHWNEYKEYPINSPMEQIALRTLFEDWFNAAELRDVLQ